jgi:hypothetical protein
VLPATCHRHAGKEMANYLAVMTGGTLNPESLQYLVIPTTSAESMCFLTARQNSRNGVPKIQLITSIGIYVIGLAQQDELHGQSFAFVREQYNDQLPSTFLEPIMHLSLAAACHQVSHHTSQGYS